VEAALGLLEPVPERCRSPGESPPVFVLDTPFPPDDKSIGYERGTTISREWYAGDNRSGDRDGRSLPRAH